VKFRLIVLILALATLTNGNTLLDSKPISLSMGNFFVGQEPYPMYVEYFTPARPTHQTPIVLIHGGATTGAVYVSTPDGREGWAMYFVRHGWKVYVVDWPGHGRSPMPEQYSTMSLRRVVDANLVLLNKIGPAVLLTHSMSGVVGWKLAETAPKQVAAIVSIATGPPANMPTGSFPAISAIRNSFVPTGDGSYFAEDKPVRYKLDAAKQAYASTALFPVETLDQFYATLVPESPRALNEVFNKDGMGITIDPKKFAILPQVLITGDEDPRHSRVVDEGTARFVGAEHIYLADVRMRGHGHMMMIEKGNQKIAQLIIDWLSKKGI
jgi:pimeloyl-ACP methyl ester carboxylesterase